MPTLPITRISINKEGELSITKFHSNDTTWIPCTDFVTYIEEDICVLSKEGEIIDFRIHPIKSIPFTLYPFGIKSIEEVGTLKNYWLVYNDKKYSIEIDKKLNIYYSIIN